MNEEKDSHANVMWHGTEVYENNFQPTPEEPSKVVAQTPRAINAAFLCIDKWTASQNNNIFEVKKLLNQKMANVEPEKIVEPLLYIAIPALQALTYSMNCEELRNLYINLLAKSIHNDTKDLVHPAFVEIIKQLSPTDALVFKAIMERSTNPLIDLVYVNDQNSFINIATNVSDITVAPVEAVCKSIENLIKQNLISIPQNQYYSNETLYEPLIRSNYVLTQQKRHPDTSDGYRFSYRKHRLEKTNLGISFYQVCF